MTTLRSRILVGTATGVAVAGVVAGTPWLIARPE